MKKAETKIMYLKVIPYEVSTLVVLTLAISTLGVPISNNSKKFY